MKLKNILLLVGVLFLGMVAITSCSSSEEYDVDGISYTRAYFTKARSVADGTVVSTPIGIIASLDVNLSVKTTSATTAETHATVSVDNSLIDKYNAANGTSYQPIPEGVLKFDKKSLTIKSGTMISSDTIHVSIDEGQAKSLNYKGGYLAPIVISSLDNGIQPSSDAAVTYIHLSYLESAINDKATVLTGTALSDEVMSNWKCVAAENLDPAGFSGLFTGDSWERSWNFTDTSKSTCSFTVDMLSTQKITAVMVANYGIKSLGVAISSDGQTFADLGSVLPSFRDDNWNYWIVFYGAMPCRYIKFTVTLDTSDKWWTYNTTIPGLGIRVE
ncbi:MAG: DUF1735 domain-containing protein [Prevotella sp.]|jgi:hypothetical protein|nr:DUF1735 domain-containing protein [Prevotella sp.]MCI1281885.1 DUF1735 domain-containing protein [Prevotella sp.]